jgi:hypothetical protein
MQRRRNRHGIRHRLVALQRRGQTREFRCGVGARQAVRDTLVEFSVDTRDNKAMLAAQALIT